jgi:hypothetical protein
MGCFMVVCFIIYVARKLLFTVGAHEGLRSGSETGRKGLRGKEGLETLILRPATISRVVFREMAVRRASWGSLSKAEAMAFPISGSPSGTGLEILEVQQGGRVRGGLNRGDALVEQAAVFVVGFE